jgi:hypothetical protein
MNEAYRAQERIGHLFILIVVGKDKHPEQHQGTVNSQLSNSGPRARRRGLRSSKTKGRPPIRVHRVHWIVGGVGIAVEHVRAGGAELHRVDGQEPAQRGVVIPRLPARAVQGRVEPRTG